MFVVDACPWKGKVDVLGAIGVVACIGAIADNKKLNEAEQALTSPIGFSGIALRLVKGFGNLHPTFFKFDLNQWQTIDQ